MPKANPSREDPYGLTPPGPGQLISDAIRSPESEAQFAIVDGVDPTQFDLVAELETFWLTFASLCDSSRGQPSLSAYLFEQVEENRVLAIFHDGAHQQFVAQVADRLLRGTELADDGDLLRRGFLTRSNRAHDRHDRLRFRKLTNDRDESSYFLTVKSKDTPLSHTDRYLFESCREWEWRIEERFYQLARRLYDDLAASSPRQAQAEATSSSGEVEEHAVDKAPLITHGWVRKRRYLVNQGSQMRTQAPEWKCLIDQYLHPKPLATAGFMRGEIEIDHVGALGSIVIPQEFGPCVSDRAEFRERNLRDALVAPTV